MKKAIIILVAAAAIVGATGIAYAHMGGYNSRQAGDGDWFNRMYQWMGFGYCSGFGAGYSQHIGDELLTLDGATKHLEDAVEQVDGTITSDVYQMGRWFAVNYEDSDNNPKQARVDIFTGRVYTDFYGNMFNNTARYGSCSWGMGGY